MKFCNAKALVEKARDGGYAVPAFNSNGGTYDIARAAIEAAAEMRSPLILQTYEPNVAYRGFDYCALQAKHLAEDVTIPIALHLDHGMSMDSVVRAVDAGYTSVMIDGSHLPLADNIRLTRAVVCAMHQLGVTVEATGVDMLAVANGTQHGIFDVQDQADLELVRKLRDMISAPLVQHGTCGIPLDLLSKLAQAGMAKINFGEGFRSNYITYFKEYADTLDHKGHPWKIMQAIKDRLKADMKELILALGSAGKA